MPVNEDKNLGNAVVDGKTGEIAESPLAAFRRSAGFQIMFVLHSGLEIGKAVDHLCASAEKFSAAQREWRPIESAPKTGERILLGHANSVWEDEWWNGDGTNGNWTECLNDSVGYRGIHHGEVPTHWTALPEPPCLLISDRGTDGQASDAE